MLTTDNWPDWIPAIIFIICIIGGRWAMQWGPVMYRRQARFVFPPASQFWARYVDLSELAEAWCAGLHATVTDYPTFARIGLYVESQPRPLTAREVGVMLKVIALKRADPNWEIDPDQELRAQVETQPALVDPVMEQIHQYLIEAPGPVLELDDVQRYLDAVLRQGDLVVTGGRALKAIEAQVK